MIKTVGIKGVIQTFSGKYINILDPQPQDFTIEDIAHHLSMLCRFNGASKYFYSVAEHSYLVSHHIKDDLKAAALLHDAAEAYVGDLISPLKSLLPEFKAIEDKIQSAIYNKFGIELSEADEHEIKTVDVMMLATERERLMPNDGVEWLTLTDIQTFPHGICYLTPDVAKNIFLHKAESIGLMR